MPKTSLSESEKRIVMQAYKSAPLGRDKLYSYIHSNLYHGRTAANVKGITQRAIAKYLLGVEAHQINLKPNRKATSVKSISNSTTKKGYVQCDLFELPKLANGRYDHGMSYVLVCVDVYTKYVWARAIPNKTSVTTQKALIVLMKQDSLNIGSMSVLQCDNGTEFAQFKEVLEPQGIKVVNSLPHIPQSNGLVERMNSTIKQMIKRWCIVNEDPSWVNALPNVVRAINKSKSFATSKIPGHFGDENPAVIARNQARDKQNNTDNGGYKFQVDDHVRLRIPQEKKLKKTGPFWSNQVYIVDSVYQPKKKAFLAPSYKIRKVESANGQTIKGQWNSGDLQKTLS